MKVSKEQMQAYEKVRQSGVTNMFDVRTVGELTGMSKEELLYIMSHYEALMEKYSIERR